MRHITNYITKVIIVLNNNKFLISYLFEIGFIIFAATGVIYLNSLYIQSIGSGMGIYNGLFHNCLDAYNYIIASVSPDDRIILCSIFIRDNYKLNKQILNSKLLQQIIFKFFNKNINDENKYFILLKIQYSDIGYRTLHKGIIISKKIFK